MATNIWHIIVLQQNNCENTTLKYCIDIYLSARVSKKSSVKSFTPKQNVNNVTYKYYKSMIFKEKGKQKIHRYLHE